MKFLHPSPFPTLGYANLYAWLTSHAPQLLSVDGENPRFIEEKFAVYTTENLKEPWLKIQKGTKEAEDYDWMFRWSYRPLGNSNYIVVDLKALANSKKLDPKY